MVIVTIMPANGDVLGTIRARYPGATMKHKTTEPGRFAVSLPSKDEQSWGKEDRTFFEDLIARKILYGWMILGGDAGV